MYNITALVRYAASAISTSIFGGQNVTRVVSGLECTGEETSLVDCDHDTFGDLFCPGEGIHDIAGVVCTDTMVKFFLNALTNPPLGRPGARPVPADDLSIP